MADAILQEILQLQAQGKIADARAICEAALRRRPHDAEVLHLSGLLSAQGGDLHTGIRLMERALRVQPRFPTAYANLGNALTKLKQLDRAIICYNRALALSPDYAEVYSNRGVAKQDMGLLDGALADFERAIALKPSYLKAHWHKALLLLLRGDLASGWRLYEMRKRLPIAAGNRIIGAPLLRGGEDIRGRTVLLHSEQGLGDTLQFCRYVWPLAHMGADVVLSVQQPLYGLLRQFEPAVRVVTQATEPRSVDFHSPLMSLPLALGTTIETIPAHEAYLHADPVLVNDWATGLLARERARPRIGLVWRGNPVHPNDHNRSIPLDELEPLLASDCTWVSLQKDMTASERESSPGLKRIHLVGERLRDFADTAAVIANLDLVITVDTSVAHLAGAMGRPVWIMLPFNPDWRWLLGREDSPWYPSARLYRQPRIGDWRSVIAAVTGALRARGVR